MELLAPLLPPLQQSGPLGRIVRQDRGEAGGVGLGRIEAVFLDVFDDARRLLAADAEQVRQLTSGDASLLAEFLHARAEAVAIDLLVLLLFTAYPELPQGLQFVLVAAQ